MKHASTVTCGCGQELVLHWEPNVPLEYTCESCGEKRYFTSRLCDHDFIRSLLSNVDGTAGYGIRCTGCGCAVGEANLVRAGYQHTDHAVETRVIIEPDRQRANDLADKLGHVESENKELLLENAKLRRALEKK